MADVAGTVVGVVSLGLQVAQGIVSYYSAYQGQIEDVDKISQRAKALHATLIILQTRLANIPIPHTASMTQVESAIFSCEDSIQRLDTILQKCLVVNLPSGTKENLRRFAKKALFPFRENTLRELEHVVGRFQSNLDTALLALIFSEQSSNHLQTSSSIASLLNQAGNVNTTITQIDGNLSNLANTCNIIDTSIQQVHANTSNTAAIIGTSLSSIERGADTVISSLAEVDRSISEQSLHSWSLAASVTREFATIGAMLNDFPAIVQREVFRALESHHKQTQVTDKSIRSENIFDGKELPVRKPSLRKTRRVSCSCQSRNGWKFNRWHFMGGYLKLVYSRRGPDTHSRDCHSRLSCESKRTLELSFLDNTKLISGIWRMAINFSSTASTFSISPSLSYRRIVSWEAPAFALLRGIDIMRMESKPLTTSYINNLNIQLRHLLNSGQASLTDTDICGTSLLHHVCLGISFSKAFDHSDVYREYKRLVVFLASHSTMPNEPDSYGKRPLDYIFREGIFFRYTPEFVDIFLELADAGLEHSLPWNNATPDPRSYPAYSVNFATSLFELRHRMPELPQDSHCGILSEAILQKSESLVRHILDTSPENLYEKNDLGQTPLHLSAGWPVGISTLLDAGGNYLIGEEDAFGVLPIAYACNWKCLPAVQLLLDADSPLYSSKSAYRSNVNHVLLNAILNSSKEIVQSITFALAARRKRLYELASRSLPQSAENILSIADDQVLDLNAYSVCKSLKILEVPVPESIRVPGDSYPTVYHYLFNNYCENTDGTVLALPRVELAEIFYDAGFRDLMNDSIWIIASASLSLHRTVSFWQVHFDKICKLVWWLAQKVNSIYHDHKNGEFRITLWNSHIRFLAIDIVDYMVYKDEDPVHRSSFTGELFPCEAKYFIISAVTDCPTVHECQCACSSRGCELVTNILKYFTSTTTIRNRISYSWNRASSKALLCKPRVERKVGAVRCVIVTLNTILGEGSEIWRFLISGLIRFATFTALDLTHTCCVVRLPTLGNSFTPFNAENRQDIQEEESAQIEELEILVAEFEAKYLELGQPILEFFDGYWSSRMQEHKETHTKPYTEDELEKIHELGVRF
ncbi:hypothetical protein NHQ30_005969 [Ciborinia camelliae]|nr:hypothetical protein NHQ30_005969 [Ciborinia camelliae]